MPVCDGCGGSYLDDFNFCPHCGRSKPKPATLHVVIEPLQARYEFAEMHLAYTGKHEDQLPDKNGKPVWGLNRWTISVAWVAYRLVTWNAAGQPVVAAESQLWRTVVSYHGTERSPERTMREWSEKIKVGKFVSAWFSEFSREYPRIYAEFDARIQADGWMSVEDDTWGGPKQLVPMLDPMDVDTFGYAIPTDVLEREKVYVRGMPYRSEYDYFPYYRAIKNLNPPLSKKLKQYRHVGDFARYKRLVSPAARSAR